MTTTSTAPTWTTRHLPPITLGRTTYTVTEQTINDSPEPVIWLTGPRGAQYVLREFTGPDTGLRQVISFKSGQPLRVHGNEVRVMHVGDVIEVATRAPRAAR